MLQKWANQGVTNDSIIVDNIDLVRMSKIKISSKLGTWDPDSTLKELVLLNHSYFVMVPVKIPFSQREMRIGRSLNDEGA